MCSMDWRLKRQQIIIIRGQTVTVTEVHGSMESARVKHVKKQSINTIAVEHKRGKVDSLSDDVGLPCHC